MFSTYKCVQIALFIKKPSNRADMKYKYFNALKTTYDTNLPILVLFTKIGMYASEVPDW